MSSGMTAAEALEAVSNATKYHSKRYPAAADERPSNSAGEEPGEPTT